MCVYNLSKKTDSICKECLDWLCSSRVTILYPSPQQLIACTLVQARLIASAIPTLGRADRLGASGNIGTGYICRLRNNRSSCLGGSHSLCGSSHARLVRSACGTIARELQSRLQRWRRETYTTGIVSTFVEDSTALSTLVL